MTTRILLAHAKEFDLVFDWHITDFVEKQCPAVGTFKVALYDPPIAPVNAPRT